MLFFCLFGWGFLFVSVFIVVFCLVLFVCFCSFVFFFFKELRLGKFLSVLTQTGTFYSHFLLSVHVGNCPSLGSTLIEMRYKPPWLPCREVKIRKTRWLWKLCAPLEREGSGVGASCHAGHSFAVISAESGQVLQLLGWQNCSCILHWSSEGFQG